jgi:hypothetical protein
MAPAPTCAVGVGQADINVLAELDRLVADEHRDRFQLVAVDSDSDTLFTAPDGARRILFDTDTDFVAEDRATYPYLTRGMPVEGKSSSDSRRRHIYMLHIN